MRAVAAFAGFVLTTVGLIVTFSTLTVNGWTVLALIGFGLIANDLRIESKETNR